MCASVCLLGVGGHCSVSSGPDPWLGPGEGRVGTDTLRGGLGAWLDPVPPSLEVLVSPCWRLVVLGELDEGRGVSFFCFY